jgi:hypothetical protein
MIKDNLVLIFWITFLAFSILALQRLYIHSNHISLIQLLFVCLYLLFISNNKIFFFFFFLLQSIFCITTTFPLLIAAIYVKPPSRYPDLWIVLISACSCVYFLITLIQFHQYQFKETTFKQTQIKKTN